MFDRRRFLHRLAAVSSLASTATIGGCVATHSASTPDLVWGRRGIEDGRMLKPRAITIDRLDRLFIADTTGRIQCFDADGKYLFHWRTPEAANGRPTGLGYLRGRSPESDRVLVADTHYYRVLAYRTDGTLDPSATIGGSAGSDPGQFAFVTDVATDADGCRYVGEYNASDRIQKFDPEGRFICSWGGTGTGDGEFIRPQSLMIRDRVLYVADACNHRVQRFDLRGETPELIDVWGSMGNKPGQLFYPYGLDFAPDGDLLVVEYKNARVQRFATDGTLRTSWGRGGVWGGPGFDAGRLNQPWGLVTDSLGRVHVLDSNNHRVQRFHA